jgi:drug/metabolite transporter (DMT)-like permease
MSSTHALKMRLAPWALLLVSASWGLAFVVMKDAIERQSVNSFLFTRFLVAVIAMFLLSYFDLWMESYDQYSEQRTLVIPCCLLVGAVLLQLTASA